MTDQGVTETENTQAWRAQVRYHQDRAAQEQVLARRSRSDAARTAHSVLREHHLQLAASAELVATMRDAEPPQSSALQHTGWLMRESYGEKTRNDQS
ncbi:hypothetical protein [Sphingomonas faeni]|uniref:hypothetical protein n=1 Tax=Sphingomonas faeni TaxID=185950 RepID=UPI0020C7C11F|nr:hypothetical protein [Sphingomonas faeni]MCP8890892.1 hypothetical protein [Sphingomonas faeni]